MDISEEQCPLAKCSCSTFERTLSAQCATDCGPHNRAGACRYYMTQAVLTCPQIVTAGKSIFLTEKPVVATVVST